MPKWQWSFFGREDSRESAKENEDSILSSTFMLFSSQDHYQEKLMKAASIVFGNRCSPEMHLSHVQHYFSLLFDQTSVLGTFSNGSLQRGATTMNVWSEKQAVDWVRLEGLGQEGMSDFMFGLCCLGTKFHSWSTIGLPLLVQET